jgi:glycerol kinase
MAKILVIDEGTSSTRAGVYDESFLRGEFVQMPVPLISPSPDIVEQDADIIWQNTLAVARKAAEGQKIDCIGITNQRETTILWERATGKPIHNALVWQDRRGADFGDELRAKGLEKTLNEKTGLLADAYFSAFKIRWLLQNIDGLWARCVAGEIAFGNVDTWLVWNLTGGKVHATDASNASRTALFNIHTNQWDMELLAMFSIPPQILPEVRDSNGNFGETTLFGAPIPITGILGDQQAALMGQNCAKGEQAKITFGTGAFLMVQLEDKPKNSTNKMLLTIASRINGKTNYALEGSVLNAGTAIQYIRDELGLIKSASETEALASSIPDNGGVYFVPAFTGLGAPHWRAEARGIIIGLGRKTGRAHIVRAALEASAYQTLDLLEALKKDGVNIEILRIDGGMVNNEFFCQFLADICNVTVEKPQDLEMTAMGAARIAIINSSANIIKTKTYKPQMPADIRQNLIKGWQDAVSKT